MSARRRDWYGTTCPGCAIVTVNGRMCPACRLRRAQETILKNDQRLVAGFAMMDDDIGQDYDCQDGHYADKVQPYAHPINPIIM